MAPLLSSTPLQTLQPAVQTIQGGTGREKKVPQLPISLQIRAPRSAGWLPGPVAVGPVPLLCSVPPGCLCPRRPRKKKRPARPGGGTGHTSAGAPTLRSARAQGLSAHLRSPRVGGSASPGTAGPGELPPPSIPGPPRSREAGGSQDTGTANRSTINRFSLSPAPLPESPERTTARQRSSSALTEARRDALLPPDACSPRPATRRL